MQQAKPEKKKNFLDRYFKITEKGSTIGKELLGGLIVFLAMLYILPVNTNILSGDPANMSSGAVFAATAICSAICSIFMGVFAKYPVALSAGMGMNAFIAYTVCGTLGYTWGESLTLIFFSGVLFFILTLTPLREKIINAIPQSLKYAISAGLGAFICFVGLKMSGIISPSTSTLVELGDLSNPTVLLGLFGIILVLVLLTCKNALIKKLAIIIAMVAVAIVGLILGLFNVEGMPSFSNANLGSVSEIKDTFGECFKAENLKVLGDFKSYAVMFALIFVNLFDTTATLLAVGKEAGMLDEKGELKDGKKAMLADAGGAFICGILGTSTVTSFAESTIGVESGAKTGLTATFTGLLFALTLLIFPAFSIFMPIDGLTPITSLALVAVGAMMFSNLKHLDWDNKIIVFASFITVIMMLLTYSLSDGLGFGLITYSLMMIFAGKGKEVHPFVYGISVFFILNFVLNATIFK